MLLLKRNWGSEWSKFEYVDGILTINESSGIEQFAAERKWFDVYNMSGQKLFSSKKSLSTLPHGIYIIKGRKVIIKWIKQNEYEWQ